MVKLLFICPSRAFKVSKFWRVDHELIINVFWQKISFLPSRTVEGSLGVQTWYSYWLRLLASNCACFLDFYDFCSSAKSANNSPTRSRSQKWFGSAHGTRLFHIWHDFELTRSNFFALRKVSTKPNCRKRHETPWKRKLAIWNWMLCCSLINILRTAFISRLTNKNCAIWRKMTVYCLNECYGLW